MIKHILTFIVLIIVTYFVIQRAFFVEQNQTQEMMSVTVYVQDKEQARISDCSITIPVAYQILKQDNIIDASLKKLFEEELALYGVYQSVKIENNIAQVFIGPGLNNKKLESLSSCEIGHLFAVLEDTLTQYDAVSTVELYMDGEKVEF
jgi:hypothetical protein